MQYLKTLHSLSTYLKAVWITNFSFSGSLIDAYKITELLSSQPLLIFHKNWSTLAQSIAEQ